jgi:serine/threonine protein kinase
VELSIGQVIGERYQIEERLGSGAMGVVYRARHVKLGRPYAIKVLHPPLTANAKLRKRFQREAEIASSLRHKNLVGVVDIGETEHLVYLVMELADGSSLQQIMNQAPLSSRRVIDYMRQLCAGLDHAHSAGLIHRDFKPENVIVERDTSGTETLRIIDFGIAILRDRPTAERERLTTEGIVLGTPHYMAPEHASGDPVDHRIDLFALGVICFEMMTGVMPFEGDGVDVARANMMHDVPSMAERVPFLEVDPLLETFTRKLMARQRDHRMSSAKAARELLDLIERDRPAAAAALGFAVPTIVASAVLVEHRPRQALAAITEPPPLRLRGAPNTLEPVVSTVPAPLPTDQMQPLRRSHRHALAVGASLAALVVVCVIAAALSGGEEPAQVATTIETPDEAIAMPAPPPPPPEPARAVRSEEPVLKPRPPAPKPLPTPRPPVIAKRPSVPATPMVASQVKPRSTEVAPPDAPTATVVADLYGVVGRGLGHLQQTKGSDATIDLWPRFRHIRINDAIATPDGRRATQRLLQDLQRDMAARR